MEDYGFEYSDEEPEEQDVDIENQYYNSKGTISQFVYIRLIQTIGFISIYLLSHLHFLYVCVYIFSCE